MSTLFDYPLVKKQLVAEEGLNKTYVVENSSLFRVIDVKDKEIASLNELLRLSELQIRNLEGRLGVVQEPKKVGFWYVVIGLVVGAATVFLVSM